MKLVVGNWKMYPRTLSEAKRIVETMTRLASPARNIQTGGRHEQVNVVLCPPALFIAPLLALSKNTQIVIGAQNTFILDEGAYTGETSPYALASLGATHVILGHSERRLLGEVDALISKKVTRAAHNKLRVILCVGERLRDDAGAYFTEVGNELRASLEGFPRSEIKRLIIAYEPIWAIGANALSAAEPKDFREMSIFIRRILVDRFGKKAGFVVPILYGGSVDDRNAEGFLREGGADGFLVGRASLDPKKFAAIIETASLRSSKCNAPSGLRTRRTH
ncbi:MAG: triose-phosphate isomerase [Patescibacteria group bacterium]